MSRIPNLAEIAWELPAIKVSPQSLQNRIHAAIPGLPPFLRGPYPAMYASQPWTIRQYAGFSTAADSNHFFRQALASGARGLSVAFDLPTHRGYCSDQAEIREDVGLAGVAIDTAEDMQLLFEHIPLDKISVSMTMNGAVLPIMAFYILAAEANGISSEQLSGTLQNDILKEFIVRNTYIYPPEPSMRIVTDIMVYCRHHMPSFNPISVSGYHMQEAGAPPELELGLTLADGLEYLRAAVAAGLDVNEIAPRMSFFFAIGMDVATETAKLRAARKIWAARVAHEFAPKHEKSLRLRTHTQTSGVSLTAHAPLNNLIRTALEALFATLGGTQSLHTNSLDEALALPSDRAARLARNTQLILQHEAGLGRAVDPLGGGEGLEALTEKLCEAAGRQIDQIEALGGMAKAIEQGYPMGLISAAALEAQVAFDSGEKTIIGVNVFAELSGLQDADDLRSVTAKEVYQAQSDKLKAWRARRNNARCKAALEKLKNAAERRDINLLAASLDAARAGATLGEISFALEQVFGRFHQDVDVLTGVYGPLVGTQAEGARARTAITEFAGQIERVVGHVPRILLSKLGQDGHDRGLKVMAAALGDLGFEVTTGPLFTTAEKLAELAATTSPDLIGISSHTAAHMGYLTALRAALDAHNLSHTTIVLGGIIPQADYDGLSKIGIDLIFPPGTKPTAAAIKLLNKMAEKHGLNARLS